MDKETLIRLATPASIFVLALSIISVPIVTKAGLDEEEVIILQSTLNA